MCQSRKRFFKKGIRFCYIAVRFIMIDALSFAIKCKFYLSKSIFIIVLGLIIPTLLFRIFSVYMRGNSSPSYAWLLTDLGNQSKGITKIEFNTKSWCGLSPWARSTHYNMDYLLCILCCIGLSSRFFSLGKQALQTRSTRLFVKGIERSSCQMVDFSSNL